MFSTQLASDSKPSDASAAEAVLSREAVDVAKAVAAVALLPITNQAELDALGAGVKSVKSRLKEIEAWEHSYTRPLLAVVESYREHARPAKQAYAQLEQAIKNRMLRYRNECKALEDEARRVAHAAQLAAHQAAQAGQGQQAQALQTTAFRAMQAAAPALVTAGVGTTKTWAVRVVDKALVPEQFKVVDEAALVAHVRALNGPASGASTSPPVGVPDVEIYVKETISVR
jgi:hypothetical protein